MGRRDQPRRNTRPAARKRDHAEKPLARGAQDQPVEGRFPVPRFWPLAIVGLTVMLAAYLAHAWHFRHYINDDAFITFRYSRFLAMGRGPYFNVGERVEGYSNPLLMLLMVPVIAWGGEHAALPGAKVIGVACGALSMVAAFALCLILQRREPRRAAVWMGACLAAGLIAVSPSYAFNSMSGLETTLFGLSVTAGVLLGTIAAQQGRWRGAGLAFACAVLSRPEGVLIVAVFWCAQAISAIATRTLRAIKAQLVIDAAIVSAVFGAQLVFRRMAYGEWLPMTYFAKSGGFWAFDAGDYVRDGIAVPLGGVIAIAIGAIGCVGGRSSRRWIAPAAIVAVTGALLPFVTGTDWMPGQRLLMPYLPLAAVLMAIGWCRVAGAVIGQPAWLAPALALLLVPVIWVGQERSRTELFDDSSIRARGYQAGHTALGEWLRSGAAKPGDAIALMDTGIIGYLCIDQRILDITGLTNRFVAKSPGGFLDKQYDPAYVLDQKPRFIVLVLKSPGNPEGQPTGAGFSTWTNIERNILHHPDFNRWYRRPRVIGDPGEPWLDRTAKGLGAARMFLHAHPGVFYLLTVFERQDRPDTWSS
jgi:arabinofuranosyltransferase